MLKHNRKKLFAENVWPANSAMFIYVNNLNSLTKIDTFSWLNGPEVNASDWGVRGPGFNSRTGKDLNVWFTVLLLCFYFFVQNILFITKFCNSFKKTNLFSILTCNILQFFGRIIRVSRYRPRIFKLLPKTYLCFVSCKNDLNQN